MRTKADSPTKSCTIDGCGKPLRARGYCGSHYNQILCPDRHPKVTRTCEQCGQEYDTQRTDGRFHSLACRDDARLGTTKAERDARREAEAKRVETARVTRMAQAAVRASKRFTTEARECAWCGLSFMTTRSTQTQCSYRCMRKAHNARRRAREHGALGCYTWAEVVRVWLNIDKCCAYCHQPSNDIQPDHVIALSRGGSNSITNVVPCCSMCNADKRELSLTEWATDRERRNLEPRSLNPRLTYLTDALLVA